MPIHSDEVRRIAALAELDLDDPTVERFRDQLQAILDHVAMLDALGVERIPPTSHAGAEPIPLRSDEAGGSLEIDEALRNAPDASRGHFRVPRVIQE